MPSGRTITASLHGVLAGALMLAGAPAQACSYKSPPNRAATRRAVEQALEADVVLKGVVVESDRKSVGATNAIRPIRVYKGERLDRYEIEYFTSCSGGFSDSQIGETWILGLYPGKDERGNKAFGFPTIRQPGYFRKRMERRLARIYGADPD